MDNELTVDLEEVAAALHANDVIAFRFSTVDKRLLVDFRSTSLEGPMVRPVEPAGSVAERYESLKELRPRFPSPPQIVAIWWPRSLASLERTGVWQQVLDRVEESGHEEAVRRANSAYLELEGLEREHRQHAINGDGFKTLWSRSASPR